MYWFDFHRFMMDFKRKTIIYSEADWKQIKIPLRHRRYPHLLWVDGNLIACTNWLNSATLEALTLGMTMKSGHVTANIDFLLISMRVVSSTGGGGVERKEKIHIAIIQPYECMTSDRKLMERNLLGSLTPFFLATQPPSFHHSFVAFFFSFRCRRLHDLQ